MRAQIAAKIFDRGGRFLHRLFPGVERFREAIEVFDLQLRARETFPRIGIVWRSRDDATAQFNDRRLIVRILRSGKLRAQLRNVVRRGAEPVRSAQQHAEEKCDPR